METYRENHSFNLAVVVGAVLIVGSALAYMLTWVSSEADEYGDGASSGSLGDVTTVLGLMDRAWVADLAKIGVVVALVAAIALPRGYSFAQKVCISLGGAAALFLPIYVYRKLGDRDHVGAGLVIFALAAVITIIAPWVIRNETASTNRYVDPNYHPRQSRENEPPPYLR